MGKLRNMLICSILFLKINFCHNKLRSPDTLWKRHLKIVTIGQPPFAFSKEPANFGFMSDLLGIMFKDANITFHLHTVTHNAQNNESSEWQSVVREVTSGRADMIAAPLTITWARMKQLKFSFPYMPANVVVVIKKPSKSGEKIPFKHLKELPLLSAEKKLIYGLMKGGATEAMLKETSYKMYHDIYDQLIERKNEGHNVLLNSYETGLEQVRNDSKFAFIGDEVFLEYASTRHPCDTMVWGKPLNTAFYGLAFPLNVPKRFLDYVNQRLMRMQRFGKMRRLKDKWWDNECDKLKLCICSNQTHTCL